MVHKLPPLKALKAFVVSANTASFTKAAIKIGLTQGALSKQVKLLEDHLGLTLFKREHRELVLTKAGTSYLAAINKSFDVIERATEKLIKKSKHEEVLHINILPSWSQGWLIPKLDDFKSIYSCDIDIRTGDGAIDFDKTGADVAIRVAKKNVWKEFCVTKFMGEDLLPVCAPSLIKGASIKNGNDLAKYNLILHGSRSNMWQEYLKAISWNHHNIKHELAAEHFFMLIQMAKDKQGIALVPRALIEKELQQGVLVTAFSVNFKSDWNYYFISPKQKSNLKKVRYFREWMVSLGKET